MSDLPDPSGLDAASFERPRHAQRAHSMHANKPMPRLPQLYSAD